MTRRFFTKIVFLLAFMCLVTFFFASRELLSPRQKTAWSEKSLNFLQNRKQLVNSKPTTFINTWETTFTKLSNARSVKTSGTFAPKPTENVMAKDRNPNKVSFANSAMTSKSTKTLRIKEASTENRIATKAKRATTQEQRPENETTSWRNFKELYGEGCKSNELQKDFPTLMKYWNNITVRRKIIDYFICFGSLLGSWLHGQAIPYDHDMDICIFRYSTKMKRF